MFMFDIRTLYVVTMPGKFGPQIFVCTRLIDFVINKIKMLFTKDGIMRICVSSEKNRDFFFFFLGTLEDL